MKLQHSTIKIRCLSSEQAGDHQCRTECSYAPYDSRMASFQASYHLDSSSALLALACSKGQPGCPAKQWKLDLELEVCGYSLRPRQTDLYSKMFSTADELEPLSCRSVVCG